MTFAVAANEKGEKVLTMSKEYIEREKALSNIDKAFKMFQDHDDMLRLYSDTRLAVIVEPAADVAPVRHGRWTIAEDDYYRLILVKCSVCHDEWCFEERDDVFDLNYHYCPNCGAYMMGENNGKCE